MNTKGMLDWTQIVANLAAAAMLLFAACEFRESTQAQRLQNSISVLNEGLDVERRYREGTASARDIVAFYYRVYVARARGGLDTEVTIPLERSLCSTVIDDPRVGEYWDQTAMQARPYFIGTFVEHMNSVRSKKSCE